MKSLTVSLIQMNIIWNDKNQNLINLENKLQSLPKNTQIVVLPEMFATGFCMEASLSESMDGLIFNWLKRTSHTFGKIITGSILIKENDQYFNRLIWMLPNGQFYKYDKRHLFSYSKENELMTSGEKRLIVQVNGWKICLQICYDLRFPVWSRQQNEHYDILVNIANWPEKRNLAWKVLLQARAIENQCFVIGVNRVGSDEKDFNYIGDSCIIDPIGNKIKYNAHAEIIITHTFEKMELLEMRKKYPFLEDADDFIII